MSLLVTSAILATGLLAGRLIARLAGRGAAGQAYGAKASPAASGTTPARKRSADFDGFACKLGDVVLRAGGDEAWLAGALVMSEQRATCVLFLAPDASGVRAIYAKPSPSASLGWFVPLAAGALNLTGEPPSTIEHAGQRFERVRRLPLRVTRLGSGTPDVGDSTIVAEYNDSAGGELLVLASSGRWHAWLGSRLEPGMFQILPGPDDFEADEP